MLVTVASGKGGTGKTLVATSLVELWVGQGVEVAYADVDVEEPNGHLFLAPTIGWRERARVPVPTLGSERCAAHGKCQQACAFNAILSTQGRVMVFDELCHGCGACLLACPDQALRETTREIGTIRTGRLRDNHTEYLAGELDVGEARSTPLVEAVMRTARRGRGITVIDAPPGTSCPVKAAIDPADFLLLVTEPTPFGMHDLELAVKLGRALRVPRLGAVINRCDLGGRGVVELLEREHVPVLAEIPFDRRVAEAYAKARSPLVDCPDFRREIEGLGAQLRALAEVPS